MHGGQEDSHSVTHSHHLVFLPHLQPLLSHFSPSFSLLSVADKIPLLSSWQKHSPIFFHLLDRQTMSTHLLASSPAHGGTDQSLEPRIPSRSPQSRQEPNYVSHHYDLSGCIFVRSCRWQQCWDPSPDTSQWDADLTSCISIAKLNTCPGHIS